MRNIAYRRTLDKIVFVFLTKHMERINQPCPPESLPTEPDHEIFWKEGFESPRRIIAKSGNVVLATEKGLRDYNQDALVIDIERDAFAVVDGMGGYGKGELAAQIVAKAIKDDFEKPKMDPQTLQQEAHLLMRQNSIFDGGAVYLAGRIELNGKELSIYGAGDAELIVTSSIGSDKGKIKFSSEPTPLENVPRGKGPGRPMITNGIRIGNHDRIVAAVDGLWDNVSKEEVAQIVANNKIHDALKQLAELAKQRMVGGRQGDENFGNPDNLSVVIYEILPMGLRGK